MTHRSTVYCRLFWIFTVLFAAFNTSTFARAQGETVRIFNPPVVNVEISGVEPAPLDANVELLSWGGGGGDCSNVLYCGGAEMYDSVQWVEAPNFTFPLDYKSYFGACGFNTQPLGTLRLPSGKQKPIVLEKYVNPDGKANNCYEFNLAFTVGDELGHYTIIAESPDGKIETSLLVDYPFCRLGWFEDSDSTVQSTPRRMNFLGFQSNEKLTFYFYDYSREVPFLAARQFQVDESGSLIMNLTASRSSDINLHFVSVELGQPDLSKLPAPKYPTYVPGGFSHVCGYSNNGGYAVIMPETGESVPLYDRDGKTVIGQLERGDIVAETGDSESGVLTMVEVNGTIIPRWTIITETKITGYVYGRVLVDAIPRVVPGTTSENVRLQTEPRSDAPIVSGTRETTRFIYVSRTGKTNASRSYYWLVKTDNGLSGYAICDPETSNCPNPWKPTPIGLINSNSSDQGGASGGGTAISPSTATCAGFNLPSRVNIGMTALVDPLLGSANFINSEAARPSLDKLSKKLGAIPVNGQFEIIGGPECNHKILWWQITWNGITGWTGEGTGNEYWIKPVN